MKKITLVTILGLLIFSIIACGAENQNESKEIDWTLGINDDLGQKYSGEINLSGWIIYKPKYEGEEEEPHFKVINTDKLPEGILQTEFRLKNLTQEKLDMLLNYNENNPAIIRVNELVIPGEGTPSLNLLKILKKSSTI